jgi:CheY-like chemotaxis protein
VRILVVEDDRDFLDDVKLALSSLPGDVEFEVAPSRDTAFGSISRHYFDLIILDLTIPTIDGALDASIEHGNAVFGQCQVIAPGTPIFILTGSTADEIFADLLGRKEAGHFWGEEARRGSVDFLQKRRFDEFTTKISPIASAINALNEVEVQKGLKHFQLSLAEDRLIRSFVKGRGGARCVLALLTGGLSDARVFRAKVFDGNGATRINAVAKIGSHAAIRAEATRYDKEISRLSPNATPRHLETINFGGKDTAGVFYSLAEGYDRSLFQIAVEEPALIPKGVDCVASLTAPWRDRVPESRSSIARVRRRALDDAKFRELTARYSLDWVVEFEGRKIQIRENTIHGDLHGDNILINQSGEATLIDYVTSEKGPRPMIRSLLSLAISFILMVHSANQCGQTQSKRERGAPTGI